MRTIKYCLLIFTIVVACAVKNKDESSSSNPSLQSDNSFDDFFKNFSTDSAYQISRIKFPLKYFSYEDDPDSLTSTDINIGEWTYINFSNDSLAASRKENAFNVEIDRKDSTIVEYLRKGIDNGISMVYSFEKDGARWYLTKIIDQSN